MSRAHSSGHDCEERMLSLTSLPQDGYAYVMLKDISSKCSGSEIDLFGPGQFECVDLLPSKNDAFNDSMIPSTMLYPQGFYPKQEFCRQKRSEGRLREGWDFASFPPSHLLTNFSVRYEILIDLFFYIYFYKIV